MKIPVETSIEELLKIIDPQGFTAEQFCKAVRDQPVPSYQYYGCMCSEDIAQHYLSLAQKEQLAVFRAGSTDASGKFTPFDIPWIYGARSESIGDMSVEILRDNFPHDHMTNRHWGYAAERRIKTEYPGKTLQEVLYSWVVALRQNRLVVDFKNVVPQEPYSSEIVVSILPVAQVS